MAHAARARGKESVTHQMRRPAPTMQIYHCIPLALGCGFLYTTGARTGSRFFVASEKLVVTDVLGSREHDISRESYSSS